MPSQVYYLYNANKRMNSFSRIIKKFYAKSYSKEDLLQLFFWLNSKKGNDEIDMLLNKSWDSFEDEISVYINSEEIFQNVKKGIRNKKSKEFRQAIPRLLPYASMFLLILGFAFYFYYDKFFHTPETELLKNRITSVITKNGQRSMVVLPDSSTVWLNSGTTLTYRDNLSENKREVILNGQAFFDVAENEDFPFTVQTGDFVVSVTGTSFDVNAYPESGVVSVALESGKVELMHRRILTFNYTMQPEEVACYNLSKNSMNVTSTDIKRYSSWKDGLLIFRNEPIKTVFDKLTRWFNIDIEVLDNRVYESIFTGTIQYESYEQIFRLIEYSCPLKCRINHNSDTDMIPKIFIERK